MFFKYKCVEKFYYTYIFVFIVMLCIKKIKKTINVTWMFNRTSKNDLKVYLNSDNSLQ